MAVEMGWRGIGLMVMVRCCREGLLQRSCSRGGDGVERNRSDGDDEEKMDLGKMEVALGMNRRNPCRQWRSAIELGRGDGMVASSRLDGSPLSRDGALY